MVRTLFLLAIDLLLASSLGDLASISPYTGEVMSLTDIGRPGIYFANSRQ